MNPPSVGGARAFNELYVSTDPDPDPAGGAAARTASATTTGSAAPYLKKRKAEAEQGQAKAAKVEEGFGHLYGPVMPPSEDHSGEY